MAKKKAKTKATKKTTKAAKKTVKKKAAKKTKATKKTAEEPVEEGAPKKKKKKVDDPYKDFRDFSHPVSSMPYHKTLAINRESPINSPRTYGIRTCCCNRMEQTKKRFP